MAGRKDQMHPTEFELRAKQFASLKPEREATLAAPSSSARRCVICGARVRNQNPKTTTCDEVCTGAKRTGRTRQEQLKWEMEHAEANIECCDGCGMFTSQCQCWDAVNGIN